MSRRAWANCTDPAKMLDFLGEAASPRRLRLFAAACCRRIWHLLRDGRSRAAVTAAEAHADGLATEEDLGLARRQADDAYRGNPSEPHDNAAYAAVCSCLASPRFAASSAAAYATYAVGSEACQQVGSAMVYEVQAAAKAREAAAICDLVREMFGNPFHQVECDPAWLVWNDRVVERLAKAIDAERAFDRLPILADATEEAGCQDAALLEHLRGPGPHVHGCFALDLLLGKE
jgi:hypothetical protein